MKLRKKWLSLGLSLVLACSLTVPALAAEEDDALSEDDWSGYVATEYDEGWEAGYEKGYDEGCALGAADGRQSTPNQPNDYDYLEGDTYDDGYANGYADGKSAGYADGYADVTKRDCGTDQELLEKGGVPGQVNVMFDGRCVAFPDAAPKIVNSRTMIPVRAVMENLGQQVEWDPDTRTVTITSPTAEQVITLTIGSDTAAVTRGESDKETYTLDAPAYINDSRTMVPLRFLSETCGYTVLWDQDHRTAVVVDDDALIDELDSKFTHLNSLLASQTELQAGKKYQQTEAVTGKVTFYDEDGKAIACPFSASAVSYTDGRSCRMELSFDLKEAVTTLVQNCPELVEDLDVDLHTALTTDLSNVTATLLLTPEGQMYLQMPLLNRLLLGSTDEAAGNTWLDLGSAGMELSQTETLTIGQAVVSALLTDENAFYCQEILDLSAAMLEAVFGDQTAKVSGSSVTWTLDSKALAAAMGTELDETSALLDACSLVTTMDRNGAYNIAGSWKADLEGSALALDLKSRGSMTDGSCAFTCSVQDLFALELSSSTTIQTVSTLPSFTLPEGAVGIAAEELTA